ncbi:MAG: extracellular solute-binding protein [Candidatus Omnitrophica bacterium]|nr:extracellular solute-binding protein [Candidatus Omnitrophota bacterium]
MKKIVYSACIIIAFLISGCGKPVEPEKEIVMWLAGSETQAMSVNEIGKEFYKINGVRVRCEAISWGEAHSKYLTSIAGGVAPDIGTMGLTWGTEFGNLGVMIDLREAFSEDVNTIKKKIFPGMWKSINYRGKIYGIPFDMTEHVLYYRNDIIKTPPDTWSGLVDILKELNKDRKSMIFDWGSLNWIGYSIFLWQAGGDYYNESFTRCTLDTEEAASGMRFFANLYNEFDMPKTQIPVEQGIRTGDFPLAISGNWKIVSLAVEAPEIGDKWSIAMLPKGPSGRSTAFIGGRIMGVFAQSKMKKEAWQFIKFLFEPENQIKFYKKAEEMQDAYLPPNMDAWETLPIKDDFKEILKMQALDAKGPPPVVTWEASTRFVDQAIQRTILAGMNAKEALNQAAHFVDEELKKTE